MEICERAQFPFSYGSTTCPCMSDWNFSGDHAVFDYKKKRNVYITIINIYTFPLKNNYSIKGEPMALRFQIIMVFLKKGHSRSSPFIRSLQLKVCTEPYKTFMKGDLSLIYLALLRGFLFSRAANISLANMQKRGIQFHCLAGTIKRTCLYAILLIFLPDKTKIVF